MQYISDYSSPLGTLFLSADEIGLTGVWMEKRRYFVHCPKEEQEKKEIPVFQQTKRWLDTYFSGKEPDFSVPLHLIGTDSVSYTHLSCLVAKADQLRCQIDLIRFNRPKLKCF